MLSAVDARAQGPAGTCEDATELAVLASPIAPWKGVPLRVMFSAEKPLEGELSLIAPNGSVAAKSRERHGGPPYSWFAEVAKPVAGKWQAKLVRDNAPAECSTITREIVVRNDAPPRPRATDGSVWPVRNAWNRETENLYSAWIEKLFDAPLDATLSWPALHEVLRDRSRNFLFNHMGLDEDSMKMFIRPDCADLPYFLRAYFAFKMGLPFGYAKCTRGGAGQPPKCLRVVEHCKISSRRRLRPKTIPLSLRPNDRSSTPDAVSSRPLSCCLARSARRRRQTRSEGGPKRRRPVAKTAAKPPGPPPKPAGLAPAFGWYLRIIADGVHSGAGRTRDRTTTTTISIRCR